MGCYVDISAHSSQPIEQMHHYGVECLHNLGVNVMRNHENAWMYAKGLAPAGDFMLP